ncbi:Bifunctional epoxide hydrolase-like protein [Hapsidospora chrysogenum ATCC 11550]|uniref:Bifunctional epoxide hydrolase-like protein n=1 Tax=Hapsidospora chrysogenum (strain ATCC 11550 / CBS 779.69 / DSM 880 / IAM 14645 / JCM 23072 / IMI 49137) TaxID=857340 RepID=A0A086SUX5_HAPC1|nr:Bifunctional epoxide hydrolase-like protein [Hapsidospora chrysogenum ATCC 11550]
MKLAASVPLLLLAFWQMEAATATFLQKDLGFNHTREYSRIGTRTYHYLLAPPSSAFDEPIGTIVLLHGFPDLSYGWRYQIPYLTSLGYRVIAPDMLGYGRSSSPLDLDKFSLKNMSDDLAQLVRRVVGEGQEVILGGHDWGGAMVYRAALWHPDLYQGIFSVCTPYFVPVTEYVDLKDQIDAGITPTFGYQLQLRDRSIDKYLRGSCKIRQVLLALYGGTTPEGEMGFDAHTGLILKNLPKLGPSPLISQDDLDYYVGEYVKNTMRGPLSWYRTAKINFDDELPLARQGKVNFAMPGLYIGATMDTALPPELSEGMEDYFPEGLTRGEVESSHWALWQAAQGVNEIIAQWAAGLDK